MILFLKLSVPLQVLEMMDSVNVTLVLKMKETVIIMMSVMMVFYVDQTIA